MICACRLHDSLAASVPPSKFIERLSEPRLFPGQGYRPAGSNDPLESVICAGRLVELDGQRRPVSFTARLNGKVSCRFQ